MPTLIWRQPLALPVVCSTAARAVSQRSASSCTKGSVQSSLRNSLRVWLPRRWEIRWIHADGCRSSGAGGLARRAPPTGRGQCHRRCEARIRWCDPPGPGAYYPATVLTGVTKGMPAYHEEMFGPVAAVTLVGGDDEAIEVANDSDFGLGAAVFSRDLDRAEAVARRIEAGNVAVNTLVASDPRLPFGGIKQSGYGRELADLGIKEFMNAKTVVVA